MEELNLSNNTLKSLIKDISDEEIAILDKMGDIQERINDAREYGDDTTSLYERKAELRQQLQDAKSRREIKVLNKDKNSVFYTGE